MWSEISIATQGSQLCEHLTRLAREGMEEGGPQNRASPSSCFSLLASRRMGMSDKINLIDAVEPVPAFCPSHRSQSAKLCGSR